MFNGTTVDNLISAELLKLAFYDRNAISEEIHGVRCLAIEETPGLLRMSLDVFQQQLDAMPPPKKEIYTNIMRLKQGQMGHTTPSSFAQSNQTTQWNEPPVTDTGPPYSFIENENFRLRFLRCELFDVKKAVVKFLNYLQLSYEIFGPVALTRMVRISDITKTGKQLLRKGFFQVLPYRDRAGRAVVVLLGGVIGSDPIDLSMVFFYIRDAVSRDSIESQRNGVVFVGDVTTWKKRDGEGGFHSIQSVNRESILMMKKIIQAVPTRMIAIHSCWPDTFSFRLFDMLSLISRVSDTTNYALKIRRHIGNEIETRYNLRGYGIPMHLLPLTQTGSIKVKYFNEWLKIRKKLEEASEEDIAADGSVLARVVICPGLNDVVFRQGTPSMKNPGNVIFRDTMIAHLEANHNQHFNLKGHQQQPEDIEAFSDLIIRTTENTRGGRFLDWDKSLNVWVKIVDRKRIKSKVGIAYRDTSKRFLDRRQKMRLQANNDSSLDNRGGTYAFVEGGEPGKRCCYTSNRDTSHTITGVPMRSDSNYNETGCGF